MKIYECHKSIETLCTPNKFQYLCFVSISLSFFAISPWHGILDSKMEFNILERQCSAKMACEIYFILFYSCISALPRMLPDYTMVSYVLCACDAHTTGKMWIKLSFATRLRHSLSSLDSYRTLRPYSYEIHCRILLKWNSCRLSFLFPFPIFVIHFSIFSFIFFFYSK